MATATTKTTGGGGSARVRSDGRRIVRYDDDDDDDDDDDGTIGSDRSDEIRELDDAWHFFAWIVDDRRPASNGTERNGDPAKGL
jgi:hypothetical protein